MADTCAECGATLAPADVPGASRCERCGLGLASADSAPPSLPVPAPTPTREEMAKTFA